jgi:hypothetical protein
VKKKLEMLANSYHAAGWFFTFHDNTYFFAAPSGRFVKVYDPQGNCITHEVTVSPDFLSRFQSLSLKEDSR